MLLLGNTIVSQCFSPPRCGYRPNNAGGNSAMDWHAMQGGAEMQVWATVAPGFLMTAITKLEKLFEIVMRNNTEYIIPMMHWSPVE